MYRWLCYISRYRRTDSRLPALVSLVDVVEMPGLDQEEEELPPPAALLVASTGPSATEYPFTMGEYALCEETCSGRPVYKHKQRKVFIYSLASTGDWLIGHTVGEDSAWLRNTNSGSDRVPVTGWRYGDGTGTWPADPKLSVSPVVPDQTRPEESEGKEVLPRRRNRIKCALM